MLTIFEIIVSGLGVCYALVMKQMVDRAVAKDSHGFVMGMIGFGLLVLSQLAIRIITRQISEYTRSSMENKLKKDLFSSLLKKDYGRISATHSEEWMNCLTSDTVICANGMTDLLLGFLGMLLRLVGSLVLIFWLQPGFAYIMISHDARVIRHSCERVAIMNNGVFVDMVSTDRLTVQSENKFTRCLLSSELHIAEVS